MSANKIDWSAFFAELEKQGLTVLDDFLQALLQEISQVKCASQGKSDLHCRIMCALAKSVETTQEICAAACCCCNESFLAAKRKT